MTVDTQPRSTEVERKRRRWPWLTAGAVVAVLAGLFVAGVFRPYVFSGTVIQSSAPAPSLAPLVYDTGEQVNIDALRGDVVLIYFGYTHCPDICPTMLSAVAKAMERLGEPADRVTTMMVTVDPERDTQQSVGEYVRLFDDAFRGVWGTEGQVRSVATGYGVTFSYDEPDENGNYWVNHSPQLMAIDPEGVLRLVYPTGVTPAELESDLRELLS